MKETLRNEHEVIYMPKIHLTEKEKDHARLIDNLRMIQGRRSNEDMARILGISRSTYIRKAKNPEALTYKELKRLCDFTRVDIASFVSRKLRVM